MRPLRFLVPLLLVSLLAGCSSSAHGGKTATPAPTPFIPFPDHDTPLSEASGSQKAIWTAYQVETIPGTSAVADTPPAPAPTDDTNGVVPPDMAQNWASAFFRTQAWRAWALQHAQADFLTHIDPENYQGSYLKEGDTETVPSCALYPASLTLMNIPPDLSNQVSPYDQYEFVATYNPPPGGGGCNVVYNLPEGQTSPDFAFNAPYVITYKGWVHDDPLLGPIWISDVVTHCTTFLCPTPTQQFGTVAPPLPADNTNILQATPAQQAVWVSYSVQYIPRDTVVKVVPNAPKVINDSQRTIPDQTAQQWAQAFYQQATWAKWAEEQLQLKFEGHLGDSTAFNQDVYGFGHLGGVPAMPSCAAYPSSLDLKLMTSGERSAGGLGAQKDSFFFDAKFSQPCSVTSTFPDGTTQTAQWPKEMYFAGSIREDPLLGTIWYPDAGNVPPQFSLGS